MEENRELIEKLKQNLRISRLDEVNPFPFQLYSGDTALGSAPKPFTTAESRTYGWLDDLAQNTRRSLWELIRSW